MNKLACFLLAFVLIPALASHADDQTTAAEATLKAKGLTKVGVYYLTEDDAKFADGVRQMRIALKQLNDDNAKRVALEKEIKMAKGAIADWEYTYRDLNEKLATVKDAFQHNQIIGQINSLVSKIKEGTEYKDAKEAEVAKLGNSRDAYVNIMIDLADKTESIAKQYEELSKDKEVTDAITVINDKAKPKVKLGPSAEFTPANLALIKKERSKINSAIVKIDTEGHVPHCDVTLNGKVTRAMVLDSGASFVALTFDTAKSLDLNPGPKDPILRLQLANGQLVEAHQMMLKSVRVGQFTVENVECAVMPANLVAADNLLGGSFLRNFVYKLDPTAGELHLTQIGGKPIDPKANPLDPKGAATPKKPAEGKMEDKEKGNPLDK